MQTNFSMRKNSSELRFIGYFLGIALLFAYEIATSVYRYLPPLIGVFFCYLVLEYSQKQKSYLNFGFGWYFSIIFLLFAEQTHGFYIFSSVVAFFIFFYFVVDWIFATLKYRNTLLAIFVAAGYVGVFGVSNTINYILNRPFLQFGYEYGIFIAIEFLIAVVLFRGRVA